MTEPTARAISAAIWISVAIILAFGLCKMNWNAFVWGFRPAKKSHGPA